MSKHIHGGDVYNHRDCIDFSANCNPLGTPEAVIRAGEKSLQRIFEYPEVGCLPLRQAIAEYEGVKTEQVICGNGAAELIFTLCRALNPRKALLPAPTFAEYAQALDSIGCEICRYMMKEQEGLRITEDFLKALTPDLDIVFLCNPNNPTGVLLSREFLIKVLDKCRENQTFLVVDECFLDFAEEPSTYTLKAELEDYENLFLLKAFTKRYAMAGVRLGYGLTGNAALLEKMEQCVQPWNISTVAQHCGIAALKEKAYVEKGRQLIFEEKRFLIDEMRTLDLKVYDSKANYIFFHGPEDLYERCLEQKILIRDCSNYEGLGKGFYRIAVKLHDENVQLIRALKEIKNSRKK